MQISLKIILCCLIPAVVFPQIVTTQPVYPTENDSIIIFVNTSQPGAEELLNYTGTLYVHTGVNTNLGSWQHVIGSWGNNSAQPSLTRLGPNSYKLTIGKPRQFYNITNSSEKILAFAFVFRSADGTKQTRPDIFVNLFEPGITIVINNPSVSVLFGDPLRSPVFASRSDTVHIDLTAAEIGTSISSFNLYVNSVPVVHSDSNQINFDFAAVEYSSGTNTISAAAKDTSGLTDSVNFIIFINPVIQEQNLPVGIKPGINYNSSNSVTLALFAPHKQFVYVIGDFNDWKISDAYLMLKDSVDANNVTWWLTINDLMPGEEYAFQYLVDGNIRIGDPFTDKVLDPWNDQYISSSTYPNLKPYPSGKTAELVSVLQTNQAPYNWKITNFARPEKTDLIIYELLIRDYLLSHDYKTLTDTLSYLKKLGVNAIELMPVNEFEGNESWGYNPSFHFAVDKYYGPKNDLKIFIDSAHANGMAVIMDIVLNHAYGQSPLVRLYWDAFNSRPAFDNPWFNTVSPNPVFSFGYDFNHESQATKDFVDRVNRYWLEEYKFDGFRFDFTKGFTNTPGDGSAYDQARINILERMADKIWELDSSAYVILEHFGSNSEEIVLSNYGMMLWGNMNYQYNEATMGYASDLSGGYYKNRGWQYPHLVTYMESHDEERLMYKNLTYGNSNGDYNIKSLPTALNRMKLAAAFFFTIPGPKMIWQFGELGYDISIDFNCRLCNKPILWNYYSNEDRLKLFKVFAELIKLRKNYDIFKNGIFSTILSGYGKRINISHSSMDAAIIGNFHVVPINSSAAFSKTGKWYDFFSGGSIEVTDVNMLIPLQPGEFKIFTTEKLFTPEPGLLTDVEEIFGGSDPTQFQLYQNYPNPFNPTTRIRFAIPSNTKNETSNVVLKVYDVLGNEIITLINEKKNAGIYEVEFNSSNLAGGVYFYQLKADNHLETKKMILLR